MLAVVHILLQGVVLGDPNNFALNRQTLASSYLLSSHPDAAVDGDLGSCFVSDSELQPWWMVVLGEYVSIGSVEIDPGSPLSDGGSFLVYVSNIAADWRTGEPCEASSCLNVAGSVPKRYLYVVSTRSALQGVLTTLTLCDLRVSRLGPALPLPHWSWTSTASIKTFAFELSGDSFRSA